MATLEHLEARADNHRVTDSGLMQHAEAAQAFEEVALSEKIPTTYNYSKSNLAVQQDHLPAIRGQDQDQQTEHFAEQTRVMRDQNKALFDQSGILNEQSGLMTDQIKATEEVAQIVGRLYDLMYKQATKLEPKVQQSFGQGGNVYEGEYSRVNDGNRLGSDNGGGGSSISDLLRERRREQARRQPRDERGRFKRNPDRPGRGGGRGPGRPGGGPRPGGKGLFGRLGKLVPKVQNIGGRIAGSALGRIAGGMLGAGGTLGSMYAINEAMNTMQDQWIYDRNNSNFISSGWQSVKDWTGDKLGDRTDFSTNRMGDQLRGRDGNAVTRAVRAAEGDSHLGAVSASFESGGRGVNTVSTGKGDAGGVSYGAHQLSSKSGTMQAFLRSTYGAPYAAAFRGLTPGSPQFNEAYKQVAAQDPDGFANAQQQYIAATHYQPVADWFQKQYGIDPQKRSRALNEMLYSLGVQYGPGGAKSVIGEALGNRDTTNMTDEEIISRVQDERVGSVNQRFRSSSDAVKKSVAARGVNEREALLTMLKSEQDKQKVAQENPLSAPAPMKSNAETNAKPLDAQKIIDNQAKHVAPQTAPQGNQLPANSPLMMKLPEQGGTPPAAPTTTPAAPATAPVSAPAPAPAAPESPLTKYAPKPAAPATGPVVAPIAAPLVQPMPKPVAAPVVAPAAEQATPVTAPVPTAPQIMQQNLSAAPAPAPVTVQPQTAAPVMPTISAPIAAPVIRASPMTETSGPASQSFYKTDTPVMSQPKAMGTQAMPVSSFTQSEPVERQQHDSVKKVMMVDQAPADAGGGGAASGGGGGSGGAGQKNDMVQLDEIPAIIDDFGILFVNAGYL